MNSFKIGLVSLLAGGLFYLTPAVSAQGTVPAPSTLSRVGGAFVASNYAYGFGSIPAARVNTGNAATGSSTILLDSGSIALPDGRTVLPFQVGATIILGLGTGVQETITPTTVSGCTFATPSGIATCSITASFTNLHFHGESGFSGTLGLQEAIDDAQNSAGGKVVVDSYWKSIGGTTAILAGALPFQNVVVEDDSAATPQFWTSQQTASTFLAAPTTLTAVTALPSTTPVGAYTTGTYFMCVSYVDVDGQEGPCSATFSQAGLATGSFIFTAPAASAGAVGYTIYISLTGGTYSLAYQVPLSSTICTLTKIETTTPACAVANATYGQSAATATVTAITVSTSPVDLQLAGVSGTLLTGAANGRTTYGYIPGAHVGSQGVPFSLAFTAGGIGSATPISIGSVNIPAGFLNQVGKTVRICGKFLNTDVNSATQVINVYYDAAGSNVAGSPVKLGQLTATGTGTAAAYEGSFCENFITTVSGAGATAGSVLPGNGNLNYALVSSGNIVGNGADTIAAAVALINLAGGGGFSNRFNIVHNNTTGNATPQLQSLSIEVL